VDTEKGDGVQKANNLIQKKRKEKRAALFIEKLKKKTERKRRRKPKNGIKMEKTTLLDESFLAECVRVYA